MYFNWLECKNHNLNVVGSNPTIVIVYLVSVCVRSVAQLVSASALGAEGRMFKSYHSDFLDLT